MKGGGGGGTECLLLGHGKLEEIAALAIFLEAGPRMYDNGQQVICRMGGRGGGGILGPNNK